MSDICGVAQTRRTAGALDEQKAPKPIDHVQLERALKWYGEPAPLTATSIIVDAARAHLATLLATVPALPKTKMMWGVSAGAELGWVHFDTYGAAIAALETETVANARRAITIQYREVPA